MTFRIKPRYGSNANATKPIAWAIVDSDDIEVGREIHKEAAERTAQAMNKKAREEKQASGGRHFVDL